MVCVGVFGGGGGLGDLAVVIPFGVPWVVAGTLVFGTLSVFSSPPGSPCVLMMLLSGLTLLTVVLGDVPS